VIRLRPYQQEVARAVLKSILGHKGLTFSVEMSRQAGKNELSAQLEALLLTFFMAESKNIIKCSPTFKPQTVISMMRLKDRLEDAGYGGFYASEMGYIIRLGAARAIFLSADKNSNVVGNTAHLLLEVDEAQAVDKEKFNKDFKPMAATTNATTVLYGTPWDRGTLLEEVKELNLALEKKDGLKRHFRYDWQEVAKFNPEYKVYVEAERDRLGENHPLFMTQYRLLPLRGGGGFFNPTQLTQLKGDHPRRHEPEAGKTYIAGLDLAGEAEQEESAILRGTILKNDLTVLSIGEITRRPMPIRTAEVKVVEFYSWQGIAHTELYPALVDILKNVWGCKRIVVDATGIGQPVASFLKEALGTRVVPFVFSQKSKSQMGFNLLAAVNSGGLKIFAADGSEEYREIWFELEKARGLYRPNQMMDFYVDPGEGHDDYLMSLGLLVEAAGQYQPRSASGR
jgi:hypothetical protein